MIFKNLNKIFSKMEWLDDSSYDHILIVIKRKQNLGIIPLEEYKRVRYITKHNSIEYGYFYSNIYFELNMIVDVIDENLLYDRLLYFLLNMNPKTYNRKWFINDCVNPFLEYIKKKYNIKKINNKLLNKKEKDILNIINNNY